MKLHPDMRSWIPICAAALLGTLLGAIGVASLLPHLWDYMKLADWLGFLGGVIGGIFTLIAAIIAFGPARNQMLIARKDASIRELERFVEFSRDVMTLRSDFLRYIANIENENDISTAMLSDMHIIIQRQWNIISANSTKFGTIFNAKVEAIDDLSEMSGSVGTLLARIDYQRNILAATRRINRGEAINSFKMTGIGEICIHVANHIIDIAERVESDIAAIQLEIDRRGLL